MALETVEQVLVIPTSLFQELGYFHGFCTNVEHYLPRLLNPSAVSFRPRNEMEQDPSFKQLIPYVILKHGPTVFQYTRGKGQGEGRLHAKRSVGIGGHISLEDAAGAADPYAQGMQRELEEEVEISAVYKQQCVGLINDDRTEVGRVHLGVVHLFELESPLVQPREQDLLHAGFCPITELLAEPDRLESWSSLSLEALFPPRQ